MPRFNEFLFTHQKKLLIVLGLIGVFFSGYVLGPLLFARTPPNKPPPFPFPTGAPEDFGLNTTRIESIVPQLEAAGLRVNALLILKNQTLISESYHPLYQMWDTFNIFSGTKTIIGLLVGIALFQGLIDSLDDPISLYLPQYTPYFQEGDGKENITVRHLLSMAAGLVWDETGDESNPMNNSLFFMGQTEDWADYVLKQPLNHVPGTHFAYSSGSVHVLSALLSSVVNKSALEFAREALFSPLGIQDVSWVCDPQGNPFGGGDLSLSPRSLVLIGALMLQKGIWNGSKLYDAAYIDSVLQSPPGYENHPSNYGHLFWLLPAGNGYTAYGAASKLMTIIPQSNLVVVLLGHNVNISLEFYENAVLSPLL